MNTKPEDPSSEYDVIVVGAGPAGNIAAKTCAEQGLRVALIEKNASPGHKVCAGGVPDQVVKDFDIDREFIGHSVKSFHIYSESGKHTVVPRMGDISVYRTSIEDPSFLKFDVYLAKRAVDAGANLITSTRAVDVVKSNRGIKLAAISAKGQTSFSGKILIGADGFGSVVAKSTGLRDQCKPSEVAVSVQREVLTDRGSDCENMYHFFGNKISPLGYGWVYPKTRGFTVGLAVLGSYSPGNLGQSLSQMIENHPIVKDLIPKDSKLCKLEGACIPMVQAPKMFCDSVILAGDSAGQVDPTSGEGIRFGMNAGRLAALTAIDALNKEDTSEQMLSEYQQKWMGGQIPYGRWIDFQGKKLEAIKHNFMKHWENQVFLNNHLRVRKLYTSTENMLWKFAPLMPAYFIDRLRAMHPSL